MKITKELIDQMVNQLLANPEMRAQYPATDEELRKYMEAMIEKGFIEDLQRMFDQADAAFAAEASETK